MIMTTIKSGQMTYLSDCTTATEMWKVLGIVHKPKKYETIKHQHHLLYTTVANDNMDILAHINKLHEICEHLAAANHPIHKDEFKYMLLYSLPNSWNSYVISFLGNPTAMTITVHQLIMLK